MKDRALDRRAMERRGADILRLAQDGAVLAASLVLNAKCDKALTRNQHRLVRRITARARDLL